MYIEDANETNRLMRPLRKRLFAEKPNVCVICGSTDNLSHDHIIATSEGGRSVWENLQILCMPCNRKKGGRKRVKSTHNPYQRPQAVKRVFFDLSPLIACTLKEQANKEGLTLKAYIQQLCSKHADKLTRDKAKLTSV